MTTDVAHKGGEWLTSDVSAEDVFTPERLTDEHRLVGVGLIAQNALDQLVLAGRHNAPFPLAGAVARVVSKRSPLEQRCVEARE